MIPPKISYKLAKEYRRFWLLNQKKFSFEMPDYIKEAEAALEYYELNPHAQIVTVILPPSKPPLRPVVRARKGKTTADPVYRVHTATATGPAQIAYLRQHPEMTKREMAEALDISYSYACEVIRLNHIEHTPGKKSKAA